MIHPNCFKKTALASLSISIFYGVSTLASAAEVNNRENPQFAIQEQAAKKAAASPKPDASGLKPFADVIQDSKEIKGFFTLHQKDEKLWIEIRPEQLDKPFFFAVNRSEGAGERGVYASLPGRSWIGTFHKIGNTVQLLAKNSLFVPDTKEADAQFVRQSYSDSLLASTGVVSVAHPQTKAILVDASQIFFTDIPGEHRLLDAEFRTGYSLDPRNSSFANVNNSTALTGLEVKAHFYAARIPVPPPMPTPIPAATPIRTVPDPRSFFVSYYYSFTALPEKPMPVRLADDRIGHFTTTHVVQADDTSLKVTRHYVDRWRLEKKDPELAVSEPKEPIVYWIDKNVPEKYRKSVSDGILEWNKAFEKIGFKDAIVVKQQTDKDSFNTLDARHSTVRWYTGADAGLAMGPHQADPRSGEILNAHISMTDAFTRYARNLMSEEIGKAATFGLPLDSAHNAVADTNFTREEASEMPLCQYAAGLESEFGFASELLDLRGDLDRTGPEAEALAQAYVKQVVMHEVGHTLGLRHNFRASSIYTLKQLQDPSFTKVHGVAGSVMDYLPFNIAAKGEAQGEYIMSTLGPYDYWAIEYAYKPISSKDETQELTAIASRSNQPELAYGADEDAFSYLHDPSITTFDLGSDDIEYLRHSLALSREMIDRMQGKTLKPGESYERLTRGVGYSFRHLVNAIPGVLKYIGGVTELRDHAGSGRVPFSPVSVERQREALRLVTDSLFRQNSLQVSPDLLSRMSVDRLDHFGRPDVSMALVNLSIQSQVLNYLMSDMLAYNLIESEEKLSGKNKALSLSELYDGVQTAIWSELGNGADITSTRRNLQREHLKRVVNTILRPSPNTPADARSLQRSNALALQSKIRVALGHSRSKEATAHLEECLGTLTEALHAPMQRVGV